jgi:plastocyanin
MNKRLAIGVVAVFGALVAGVLALETQGTTHTIVRTNEGYEPSTLTILQGDTVEFINQSNDFHWPASDLHPTHGIYPAFDPLRPVAVGEVWSFRFQEVGEWKFHDHLHANEVGIITVQ